MERNRLLLVIVLILVIGGAYFLFFANKGDESPSQGGLTVEDITFEKITPEPGEEPLNAEKIMDEQTREGVTVLPEEELKDKQIRIKTAKGDIVFELFGDTAPIAVSNFITLASDGFYDGIIFHRREEGFVIQGGDPLGNGQGGPGYTFEDELGDPYSYEKGIVAMANRGPNTNGSQFFIMLEDYPLPKNYTIFGRVLEGQDVVDEIEIGDVMEKVTVEDKE